MKKIIYLILFSLFLNVNLAHATVGWSKNIPATSENPQAISPDVIENNTALDLMLQNYRDGGVYVSLISTSEIDIGPGGVMLSNSGGSVRLMVANSSLTAMSSANIDTGSISPSSTYYIYAYASSTTATTFSVIYSASATSPTGITYYAQIGKFTTNGSSNFITATNNISPLGVYNYSTSASSSSSVTSTLKIAYGSLATSSSASVTQVTNLPFTSSTSYSVTSTSVSASPTHNCIVQSGSMTATSFYLITDVNSAVCNWVAIGY